MPTHESEKEVFDALSEHIRSKHSGLVISLPPSGSLLGAPAHTAPTPGILVSNPETGAVLGIEVKGYSSILPVGVYPQLKAMQQQMKSIRGDLVVVSGAPMSGVLSSNIADAGIFAVQLLNPKEVGPQLEPKLRALEGK
jgi:hypothetical protein